MAVCRANGSHAGRVAMPKRIAYEGEYYRMDVRNVWIKGRDIAAGAVILQDRDIRWVGVIA
jgi:hypothetical protein